MQAIADEAGVALTASLPAQPLTVVGDHTQLHRVLTDLLSNAIKFTPVGGHATVQAAEKPHGAALIVSDNGIGVPATDQKQLFTRFFRASNATENATQGAGLGLAIVKAIITHHNGELKLASTEGRGTTVTIHLPRPEPGS
jgi:signal transduction histidine kinase